LYLYAKDVLSDVMNSFFKIGSRIQHNKISIQDVGKILNSIHFGNKELPVHEKIVYQVIINNYGKTQLVNITKNNRIEIEGSYNNVSQDIK